MEQLTKDQFDQLKIEDQVKYINTQLEKEGASLTGVCKVIGIGRSTVRERFRKSGFTFDKNINEYVKNNNVNGRVTPCVTKFNKDKIQLKPVEEIKNIKNNTGVIVNVPDVLINNNGLTMTEDQEEIGRKMGELLSMFDTIMEMAKVFENRKESLDGGDNEIVINLIDDRHMEQKTRSFRVNYFILEQWDQFTEKNRYHSKKDLLSMAMLEYMERHNKK